MYQEQLAEKMNVSRQAVTKWETGNGMPDIDNDKHYDINIGVAYKITIKSTSN